MLSTRLIAIFLFALLQTQTPAASPPLAPSPASSEVMTPSEAKQRMDLAIRTNGLDGVGTPWHLIATYEVIGPDGNSKDKGTFEEWRLSTHKYRLSFQSPAYSVEEYGDERGIFQTAGVQRRRRPLSLLPDLIMRPVSPIAEPGKFSLKNDERSFGAGKVPCTALIESGKNEKNEDAESYCFAPKNATLIYKSSRQRHFQTVMQHFSVVNGHYVARDMQVLVLGNPWLKVHIDTLEGLRPADISHLAVPPAAVPVGLPEVAFDVVEGRPLRKVTPQYPAKAKLNNIQGLVILDALIGKDGHVKDLEVLAGPLLLQKPAQDAVSQWVYEPTTREGQPVELETDIAVIFNLAG